MPAYDNTYLAIAGLVLGFSFLIFIHELGHFAVAKFVGIKCTQFAIGFGQAMVSYRKGIGVRFGSTEAEFERRIKAHLRGDKHVVADDVSMKSDIPMVQRDADDFNSEEIDRIATQLGLGETEYRLNWLPLGGYVKMLGQEDMDPSARSNHPRSFNAKSVGARFWVLSAGVIMNMIFGAIFLALAFSPSLGVQFPAATVGGVTPGSPAAIAYAQGHDDDPAYRGLRAGDRILTVNGKPAKDFMDVKIATALGSRGSAVAFEVDRAGEARPLVYSVVPVANKREEGLLSAGIEMGFTLDVAAVYEESEAFTQGVVPDTRITAVDGKPVGTVSEYVAATSASKGQPVELTFMPYDPLTGALMPGGEPKIAKLLPLAELQRDIDGLRHLAGLSPPIGVTAVVPGSPAEAAGMRAGDLLAQLGDARWPTSLEMVPRLVGEAVEQGKDIRVVVMREGALVDLGSVKPKKKQLGIGFALIQRQAMIGGVKPGSAAEVGDPIPGGSVVLSVDGQQVADWADMQRAMTQAAASDADAVTLRIRLAVAGQPEETLTIPLTQETRDQLASAGWSLLPAPFGSAGFRNHPDKITLKGEGMVDAAGLGLEKTGQFMVQTYLTLVRLVQGTIRISNLRGPVGIVHEGTRISREGLPYLLFFLGLISINLAVINFLPIPIVDGGHIVFLIIEKLKGSPVSGRVQTYASLGGLAVIGFVFLSTLYYDVGRLGVTDWLVGLFG